MDINCDTLSSGVESNSPAATDMAKSVCSVISKCDSKSEEPSHQFRAPQEFAKHKATCFTSTGFYIKKSKSWTKRQNKNCKSHSSIPIYKTNNSKQNLDSDRDLMKRPSFTKADLENIQILKQTHLVSKEKTDEGNNTAEKHKSDSRSLLLRSFDHSQLKQQQICRKLLSQHKTQHNHVVCPGAIKNYLNATTCNTLSTFCDIGRECNSISNVQCYTINNTVGITDFSNSVHHCCIRSKFFLSDKRPRKGNFIPPTKFLLGGNISDPLNLNSLKNEPSTNSLNNTPVSTPRQSPITTPPKVEVLIPPNIRDPLHLLDPVDSMEYEKQLTSPMKRGGLKLKLESSINNSRNINKGYKNRRKHRKIKRRRFESLNSSSSSIITNIPDNFMSLSDKSSFESCTALGNNINESELFQLKSTPSLSNVKSVTKIVHNKPESSKNDIKETLHLDLTSIHCNRNDNTNTNRKRKMEHNLQKTKKYIRSEAMDKIVSPVMPSGGNWLRQQQCTAVTNNRKPSLKNLANIPETSNINNPERFSDKVVVSTATKVETQGKLKKDPLNSLNVPKANNKINKKRFDSLQNKQKCSDLHSDKYCYGNYNRYRGLRCLNELLDVRLKVFHRYPELFKNKDILDIGCNVGHMTISVARNLEAKSILGVDIDQKLISEARRNLAMYVRLPDDLISSCKSKKHDEKQIQRKSKHTSNLNNHVVHSCIKISKRTENFFPISFPLTYGGVLSSNTPTASTFLNNDTTSNGNTSNGVKLKSEFPHNVFFRTTNYVFQHESQLANDIPQYDLILCLSVTKWFHLNFGDNGLKLAFKRMFNQLRPGGKLILEVQNWASYKKDKKLTSKIYNNYKNIELFPHKYHEYLLSTEVGFSHSYTLGVPKHLNKGFCRPLQLYAKGDYTPNHVRWSDAYCPQTPFEAHRGIYATMPLLPIANQSTYPMFSSNRSQNYNTYSYSCKQTPIYQSSTSQYYNPLETDSYLPSYDTEYLNHMYVFTSPLYQSVWSPPPNFRLSSSYTPAFGSIRDADFDVDCSAVYGLEENNQRHVYPPNDDTSSPNASCGNAFNSIRDTDADDLNQLPGQTCHSHVYATNCSEYCSPSQCNFGQDDRSYAEDTFLNNDDTGRISFYD